MLRNAVAILILSKNNIQINEDINNIIYSYDVNSYFNKLVFKIIKKEGLINGVNPGFNPMPR